MTNATQTPFQKDLFRWDGMYLHYEGGTPEPTFIARFKYGRKPYKRWINFICKNFTCEEWVTEFEETHAPLRMMQARGYKGN